ncbi:hypothetical protein CVT25_005108 [Psilocybe cyanescens]|uniref:Protein kinase domain-containing protein n=1 Tax=Psilocybe cyanescens TaxID=93625 RepID=A0A409XDZ3_PSICY|nr:hypothetical protein CVT25_005108 [Psilocybe cyanescens]
MENNITSSAVPPSFLIPDTSRKMDGEFVRSPVDEFLKTYLPFAPDEVETKYFVEKLLQSIPPASNSSDGREIRTRAKSKLPILVGQEEQYQFHHYPKPAIKRSTHESEVVAFTPWVDIAQAIGNIPHPQETRKRNQCNYRNMPYKRIASDILGSDNMIDAAFLRPCDEAVDLRTTDIAVVIEQKLSTVKRRENAVQAVSANVQIMNDDVRRMFTFGITIESDEVTLWYHSRSHSAVSERFSFIQNPKVLIRILAAFLFATDEELGYDPMVTREKDGCYTFKIPDPMITDQCQCFRTVDTLSEYRSNNITGRMARVYKVTKLDDKGEAIGEPLVLKDVWLDQSALTEREIQNAIFNDIEKFWQAPTEIEQMRTLQEDHKQLVKDKGYRQYFLAIVLDHSGTTTTDYPAGAVIKKGLLQEPDLKKHTPKSGTGTNAMFSDSRSRNEGTHPVNKVEVPVAPRTFEVKKHYRVVFQEVCRTVGKLGTLGEVVDVLYQALIPLQLLLCAGWVHRDISSGNIMAYRDNLDNAQEPWKVKLSDLEYARKFPPPDDYEAAVDPKTGTPYFMPIEVMQRKYLFNSKQAHLWAAPVVSALELEAEDAQSLASDSATDLSSVTVVHNFQHDLESLWWILLWTITCRINSDVAFHYGSPIFVNQLQSTDARYKCLTESIIQHLQTWMPPSKERLTLSSSMNSLRYLMSLHYIKRVGLGNHLKAEHYVSIHKDFADIFVTIKKTASEWFAIPLITRKATDSVYEQSVAPGRLKRQRPDEDNTDPRQAEDEGRSQAKLARTDESPEDKEK